MKNKTNKSLQLTTDWLIILTISSIFGLGFLFIGIMWSVNVFLSIVVSLVESAGLSMYLKSLILDNEKNK